MPSLNIIIGDNSIYTHYSRQNSIMCISHINFCDRYRIAQMQIYGASPRAILLAPRTILSPAPAQQSLTPTNHPQSGRRRED
eukprot:1100482-Pleurochrysis_carterae.AAC.1